MRNIWVPLRNIWVLESPGTAIHGLDGGAAFQGLQSDINVGDQLIKPCAHRADVMLKALYMAGQFPHLPLHLEKLPLQTGRLGPCRAGIRGSRRRSGIAAAIDKSLHVG